MQELSSSLKPIDEILIIVIAAVLLAGLVFLSVMLTVGGRGKIVLRRHIRNHEYNVRIYRLDYARGLVYYFDRKSMKKRVTEPLETFYSQFPASDVANVRLWISNLISDEAKSAPFLEVKVFLKSSREVASALYELTSVDRERQIIHFESHILPYLAYETKKRHRNVRSFIKSLSEIETIEQKRGAERGAVLLVKLFSVHGYELDVDTVSPVMIQLLNNLAPTLNEDRFLVQLSQSEIAIFDFTIDSRAAVVGLANRLKQIADSFLTINSLDDNYEITIGLCLKDGRSALKTLVGRGREMAILAQQQEDIGFELFDPDKDYAALVASSGYKEIVNMIRNKTFRYYFTPIVDLAEEESEAYMLSIEPYGTEFKTFADIVEEALELRLINPVFQTVVEGCLSKVRALEAQVKILFPASMAYVEIYESLSRELNFGNIRPYLCFTEEDLEGYDDERGDLEERLKNLRSAGVELGLIIQNETQNLTEETLAGFSYLLVSEEFTADFRQDERRVVFLKALLERYRDYKIRFAALGLDTVSDLEVAIKIGLKFFSCREFADMSSTPETLRPEQKELLRKLKNR